MSDKITIATVRKMRLELVHMEAQAERELKARSTRALGRLRKDLVEEFRRRLSLMAITLKTNK